MKTKITSIKRAFILFWHGLTGILTCIADWFAVILGMRDGSKYGKTLRRIVGTCFAIIMVAWAAEEATFCVHRFIIEFRASRIYSSEEDFSGQYVSRNVSYYGDYSADGYIETGDGEKTIKGVYWIAKPLGNDSLVCYSNGKKRGYFNKFTGKPVVEPKYDHAWIFSDGLASVDDGGWIKFIDSSGKVVMDPKIPYVEGADGFVFHNGYCVVHNDRRNRFGLIDKQGKWVLPAEYFSIEPVDSCWVVDNGGEQCVIDSELNTVIPYLKGRICVGYDLIYVTLADHTIRRYSRQGELVEDFLITDVFHMRYETGELRYTASKSYDDEGVLISETEDSEPTRVEKTAKCQCYEAETGWYGLMTADGKVITPPSYCYIKAIDYDLYLCKDEYDDGVVLNGKGERVR